MNRNWTRTKPLCTFTHPNAGAAVIHWCIGCRDAQFWIFCRHPICWYFKTQLKFGWQPISIGRAPFWVKTNPLCWLSVQNSSKVKKFRHCEFNCLIATLCNFDHELWLQETKLNSHTPHKTAILVNPGHIFMEKVSSGFLSDVLLLLFLSSAFYFSRAVWSVCSLHVAFRDLRESQSRGRAVVGHQRENQRTFSPENMTQFY